MELSQVLCDGDVHWNFRTRQGCQDKENRLAFCNDLHPYFDHLFMLVGASNRHQRAGVYFLLYLSHSNQLTATFPDLEVQGSG